MRERNDSRIEQFEISPKTIEQYLRDVVCEQRHTHVWIIIIWIVQAFLSEKSLVRLKNNCKAQLFLSGINYHNNHHFILSFIPVIFPVHDLHSYVVIVTSHNHPCKCVISRLTKLKKDISLQSHKYTYTGCT